MNVQSEAKQGRALLGKGRIREGTGLHYQARRNGEGKKEPLPYP